MLAGEITTGSSRRLERQIEQILSGPRDPDRDFTLSGRTYDEVYEMASDLKSFFSSPNFEDGPVCLCAESKAVIAAALLAALSGGPPLVLPYAHSTNVLSEVHGATGFKYAILDTQKTLPQGVQTLIPGSSSVSKKSVFPGKGPNPDRELLRLFTGGSTGKKS